MEQLRFSIFKTHLGFVACALSKHGLRHVILPKPTQKEAFDDLCAASRGETLIPDAASPQLKKIEYLIRQYVKGLAVEFALKLDYNVASPFQRQVWSVTRTIPYGQTQTYRWVAEKIGDPGSTRAVGRALHLNALPLVVPCHRVISRRGGVGGFSGGPELKNRLLQIEGNRFA
jgi:methylated-DNA-[protein]-cysteine S-methyltransferase